MQQQYNSPDLSNYFVNTGERPQNYIKKYRQEERYDDHPKAKELIRLKTELINLRNHPPVYIKTDLRKYDLSQQGKFDVIYMDPPWKEYSDRLLNANMQIKDHEQPWSLDQLKALQIDKIADTTNFLFMWCGSQHLDDGRELFKHWGYKRCEDIVWLKTNKEVTKLSQYTAGQDMGDNLLKRVKEHCLVGLKGDVKRASDSHFIHANIDTDVIVEEEYPMGSTRKPDEIYQMIERFCLGRKRIELFGETHNIREGWLTIGQQLLDTRFSQDEYDSYFRENLFTMDRPPYLGPRLLGTTLDIENLRPKSPNKKDDQQLQQQQLIQQQQYQYGVNQQMGQMPPLEQQYSKQSR